jgi:phosphoenolpyruvate carboxykinase (GTP)
MASETTAAATGQVGVVRRDPMAMLPFCGYNMADYWGHWLDIGKRLTQPPKIFRINWFRRDGAGRFLWPGYGENLRVLQWIVERCRDRGKAEETAIGYRPAPGAIDTAGLSLAPGAMDELLHVDREAWQQNHRGQAEFFQKFGDRLPRGIRGEWEALGTRLRAR